MLLGASSALENKLKRIRITMVKRKLRISLKVLEAVKEHFADTKNFIDNMMEEKCQEETMSMEEVIFLQVKKQKVISKIIFYLAVSM